MAGLLEEGDEVIAEGKEKDSVAADLALIASAQKVEHYEISAYGTARAMAGQIGLPAVGALLSKSLAEEEIADNLLTQSRTRVDVRIEDRFDKGTETRHRDRGDRRLVAHQCDELDRTCAPDSWACTPCARPRILLRPNAKSSVVGLLRRGT